MTNNANDTSALFGVMTEIGIISQLTNAALERALPDGLRLAHFVVLHHLSRLGGTWSPNRLARAMQVTKGAMTNTIGKLENRGFIKVSPDPEDGRGKLVTLTPAGQAMRDQALSLSGPVFSSLLEEFERKDFDQALPFLSRLRANLDKARN